MVMFLKKGEREDIFWLHFLVAIYSSFYYNLECVKRYLCIIMHKSWREKCGSLY